MTDEFSENPTCPDCGKSAGKGGRIRHDEFCPRRSGSRQDASEDKAPGGSTTARQPRQRTSSSAKMAKDLELTLDGVQGLLLQFFPQYEPLALRSNVKERVNLLAEIEQDEVGVLARALADEITLHPKLLAWFRKVEKASPHIVLAMVLARILGYRIAAVVAMSRMSPQERMQALAMMQAMNQMSEQERAAMMAAMQQQQQYAPPPAPPASSPTMEEAPLVPPVFAEPERASEQTQAGQSMRTAAQQATQHDAVQAAVNGTPPVGAVSAQDGAAVIPPVFAEKS